MSETTLRLLTEKAKEKRFDFVWAIADSKIPLLDQMQAEIALVFALSEALGDHGMLARR